MCHFRFSISDKLSQKQSPSDCNHSPSQKNILRASRGPSLNGVGEKAEDGPEPQKHREAAKEVLRELDPLGRGGRRREGIGPVALAVGLGLRLGEARLEVGAESLAQLRERNAVGVQVELLLQLVQLLGRRFRACNKQQKPRV